MHQSKSISVAMCTYNGEKFLREQLGPVMNFDHIQPRRMPENDLVFLVNLTSGATAGNI